MTSPLTDHDRARLATTRRTAYAGPALGAAGAVAVALLGASGRAGLAVVLLLSAAGAVAASLVTAIQALVDEYRELPVARIRPLTALGLFVLAVVLLALAAGAGAGVE